MSDLVIKLRRHALPDPCDEREVMHAPLLTEAADEIERLRKIEAMAKNLVAVKGRYHSEQAYQSLVEVLK